MANKKVIVQLASPERKYAKVYHDFLDNSFLTTEEQMIFIVLKSYVDFREDSGEAYPSMETICKRAKMSEKRARKNINSLIKKGIVKKVQRGLTKTNLYTLADHPTMWACENAEDVAAIANNQGVKPLTLEQHIAELERMGYAVQIKEREPESIEPTKVTKDSSTQKNNMYIQDNTTKRAGSQERYSLEQIRQLYDYGILLQDNPDSQDNVDAVMSVLHTALNTEKETIRIAGEDRPAMSVISKLMKLTYLDIAYSLEKFSGQTERVKNPAAYLLTILYNAKEQSQLEATNRAAHDMAHGQ